MGRLCYDYLSGLVVPYVCVKTNSRENPAIFKKNGSDFQYHPLKSKIPTIYRIVEMLTLIKIKAKSVGAISHQVPSLSVRSTH
jgi:hypothetical protein